jgi:hypothetical protein
MMFSWISRRCRLASLSSNFGGRTLDRSFASITVGGETFESQAAHIRRLKPFLDDKYTIMVEKNQRLAVETVSNSMTRSH